MKPATLIAIGVVVLIGALGVWTLTRPASEAGDAVAFERALTAPEAAPPGSTPPADSGPSEVEDSDETVTSIPRFTIGEHPEGHDREPVAIRIPALGQDAPVIPTGVEPNGDMEVPDNVTEVAWYKYGSAPGEPGSAVLAAHVDLAGQGPGVFFELRELEEGSVIFVDFDDGTTGEYRAEARTIYDKAALPTEAIFSREGPPVLTLITCGGDFNQSIRRYDSNVVVYAVPVAS